LRELIEELLAAYVTAIDDGDLERWPVFFTEDCVYRILARENDSLNLPLAVMSCDSRAALTDRVAAYRKANLFAHAYRHMLGPVRIRDEGRQEVTARTNYAVFRTALDPIDYGTSEVFSVGEYRTGLSWLTASCDSEKNRSGRYLQDSYIARDAALSGQNRGEESNGGRTQYPALGRTYSCRIRGQECRWCSRNDGRRRLGVDDS
jgi:anthranilate 1,2-dioxygenase small subunit